MLNIKELTRDYEQRAHSMNLLVQVPGVGPVDTEMAIVGEGAGQTEVETRLPYSGASGRKLFDMLRQHKMLRPQFYTTNVVKRQLSSASRPKNPILKDELIQWRELLHWELSQLPNLKYVLATGAVAAETLTGMSGITKIRGSVYECELRNGRKVTVVPTFNPAHILREPNNEIIMRMDTRTFHMVCLGDWKPYDITTHINPTCDQAVDYLKMLMSEDKPISFDIETIAFETACFGVANNGHEAMCINLRGPFENTYTLEQEVKIRHMIEKLATTTRLVAQNGQFDTTWCGYKDNLNIPIWFDTMLAHHTLYPSLPHGLDFLVSQYTTHPYYKDERTDFKEGGNIDGFWEYNCKDAALTWECYRHLERELEQQDLHKFFFTEVMPLEPHLAKSSIDGFRVDQTVKEKVRVGLEHELEVHLNNFHRAVQDATEDYEYYPNPSSPKQMKHLYQWRLKMKSHGGSTDATTRNKWFNDPRVDFEHKRIIQLHNKFAEERKFISTYAKMETDSDDRVRYSYRQSGVAKAPGRLSSAKTLWGSGANMQNQPKRAQEFYIADAGTVMFYFDLAQAEARIVAYRADIPKWKEDFERARLDGSFDCHRSLASDMFKVPYDEVPVDDWDGNTPTMRYIAKRCLTPDHQLLTRDGWKNIDELANTSAEIAVWDDHNRMKWETPKSWYVSADEYHPMVTFEGENLSQLVTYDHDVAILNLDYTTRRVSAEHCLSMYNSSIKMPMSGVINEGIDYPYARILAMTWSDGTIENNYPNSIRISIKKERKWIRLLKLVVDAKLAFWHSQTEDGMHHVRIYGFTRKHLDYDLLSWNKESREAFIDELKYWDGCQKTGRIFNCDHHGLQVIQAVAHITGYACTIRNHGKPENGHKQCYVLRPKKRKRITPQYKGTTGYTGKVYCPTVSTGKIMIRRNGKVSITCQCRHGLNYTLNFPSLAEQTGLSLYEAKKSYIIYHNESPEIKLWWEEQLRRARKDREIFNAYGRRNKILQKVDNTILGNLVAFYPQSTIGDKVKRIWRQCHEDDRWDTSKMRIKLNIHDALIGLATADVVKTALSIAKEYAEEPIVVENVYETKAEQCIIPADCKISEPDEGGVHRWSTLKKAVL